MNDQIETAAKALPKEIDVKTGTLVLGFAIYGAVQATSDVVSMTKKIIRNRKAKKAAKVIETDSPQP